MTPIRPPGRNSRSFSSHFQQGGGVLEQFLSGFSCGLHDRPTHHVSHARSAGRPVVRGTVRVWIGKVDPADWDFEEFGADLS